MYATSTVGKTRLVVEMDNDKFCGVFTVVS